MSSTATASNTTAPTQMLQASGHSYVYRRFGNGSGLPLLCLQHFTGTLDNWDPAVSDPLPNAALLVYPDAGHGSFFRYPEAFTHGGVSLFRL